MGGDLDLGSVPGKKDFSTFRLVSQSAGLGKPRSPFLHQPPRAAARTSLLSSSAPSQRPARPSNACHEQPLAKRCSRQACLPQPANVNDLAPLLNPPQPATSAFRRETQRHTTSARDITGWDRKHSSTNPTNPLHIATGARSLHCPSNTTWSPPRL
jgi:hypothetical protein